MVNFGAEMIAKLFHLKLVTKASKKHPLFFDWMSDIVVSKSPSFQHLFTNKVIYSTTAAI